MMLSTGLNIQMTRKAVALSCDAEAFHEPQPCLNPYPILTKALIRHDIAAQESMRMKPVVASGTMRVSLRDITLGGGKYRIPAGTGLWVPNYPIHNSKLNWGPDANQYRPVSAAHQCNHPCCSYLTAFCGDMTAALIRKIK